eukprot:2802079-Ditylum_brightwellii.AAC.1
MSHLCGLEQKWGAVLVVGDGHNCCPLMGLHGVPYFFAPLEMVFVLWVLLWVDWLAPSEGVYSLCQIHPRLVILPPLEVAQHLYFVLTSEK